MPAVGLDVERHVYIHPATGEEFPSFTTVLDRTSDLPWMGPWHSKTTLDTALAQLERVAGLLAAGKDEQARQLVRDLSGATRKLAARIGTYVHDVVEALILDLPVPPVPEDIVGATTRDGDIVDQPYVDSISDGFLSFCKDYGITRGDFEAAEMTVYHKVLGLAGTLDIIARILGLGRGCIDVKTGRNFANTWTPQITGYRRCGEAWLQLGQIVPMPKTDFGAVLHIRSPEYPDGYDDGYKLYVIPAATEDDAFRRLADGAAAFRYDQEHPAGRPGPVYYPPQADGTQPPAMLEDITGYCAVPGVLRRSGLGLRTVADVAHLTAADLLSLRGIKDKRVDAARAMLADHGGYALSGDDTQTAVA